MAETKKKADVEIRISRFEVPPMQDVLVIGRQAPIGQVAFKKTVDLLAPNQYTLLPLEGDERIEAILVKNCILRMLPKKILMGFVINEIKEIMCDIDILKAVVEVTIMAKKSVAL